MERVFYCHAKTLIDFYFRYYIENQPIFMKRLGLFLSLVFLLQSCKSSYSKTELLKENKALKERIKKLETADTVNKEAAIELKKINVVYRGISNPIYISKPNAVSFEATAFGLKKLDSLGNYNLSPGTGKTVDIIIKSKLKNGDSLTETKTLRIKDISAPIGTINGIGCGNKCEIHLTKEELKNTTIGVKVNDFLFDWKFVVTGFKLALNEDEIITVIGAKPNRSSQSFIEELSVNDLVFVFDIKCKIVGSPSGIRYKNPSPILIRIAEDN